MGDQRAYSKTTQSNVSKAYPCRCTEEVAGHLCPKQSQTCVFTEERPDDIRMDGALVILDIRISNIGRCAEDYQEIRLPLLPRSPLYPFCPEARRGCAHSRIGFWARMLFMSFKSTLALPRPSILFCAEWFFRVGCVSFYTLRLHCKLDQTLPSC